MRTHKRWLTVGAVLLALLLVSAIPVSADPGTVYVDGTWGTDVALCGANPGVYACATIQYAIDNIAVANDTIMVAAGTYAENVLVDVANLTVKGPQFGVDPTATGARTVEANEAIITGAGADYAVRTAGEGAGLLFDGFLIRGDGSTLWAFYLGRDDPTISNNIIEVGNFEDDADAILLLSEHVKIDSATISQNYMKGSLVCDATCDGRGIRVESYSYTIKNVVISDNKMEAGAAFYAQAIQLASQGPDVSSVSITDNLIHGRPTPYGSGIKIYNEGVEDVTITGNTLDHWEEAIDIGTTSDATAITVNYNNIVDNILGAGNWDTGVLDAEHNWWGSKSGPAGDANCYTEPGGAAKGNPVSADIDFAPWLDAPYPGGSDFAPVALDGAWSYSCIQGAIDDATASTIQTQPGTFTESVLVNKSVDILGAGRGVTKLVPSDSYGFEVVSDTVKIDGFHIFGNGTAGVYGHEVDGEVGGLTVSNNEVDGWVYGVLFEETKGNLDISGNLIHGNMGGIHLESDAGPSQIVDNEIYQGLGGIGIFDSEGLLVQENDIHDNDGGVSIDDSEVDVLGNRILDNSAEGVSVSGDSDAEVHGNYLEGGDPDVFGQLAELGKYLDAECNWWGGGPPSAGEVEGLVDYDPWIGLAVSADPPQANANGRAFTTLSGSLVCDGYAVPDGIMVDFATDLGWFTLTLQDVEANVPTVDGVAKVKLYSYYAGYATITAEAGTDDVEEDRLVTFVPRKPRITFPPHRSTITRRRPTVRWTASPSAVPTLVYQLRVIRLRPLPKKRLLDTITDQTFYQTPYLRGRKFVVKVRACLDDSLTVCSRWRRSVFKIVKK